MPLGGSNRKVGTLLLSLFTLHILGGVGNAFVLPVKLSLVKKLCEEIGINIFAWNLLPLRMELVMH